MKLTDITEQKSEDKMKYKITFEDEQLTCLAEAGTTVLEVQIAAGMTPDAFCGGNGKCGKCKVVINGKEVLACKTAVDRDMTVYTGNKKEERAQILAQGSGRQAEFSPGNLPEGTDTPLLSAVDIGSTCFPIIRSTTDKGGCSMLKVEKLNKSYTNGVNTYPVLKDVSLHVKKGEFVAVMGPSGSGKTTLLNCISCFIPHDSGKIQLGDMDISSLSERRLARVRNEKLGFVFQDFMLLDGLTVRENICLPQIIARKPVAQMEAKSENLCSLFGINKIMDKYPAEISGGEKQRIAVARALINNPYIILADEPTGNLDSRSCKAVIDAFLQAKEQIGATIFMVTHDSYAASFCDRVIVLKDGEIHQEVKRTGTRREFMDEL